MDLRRVSKKNHQACRLPAFIIINISAFKHRWILPHLATVSVWQRLCLKKQRLWLCCKIPRFKQLMKQGRCSESLPVPNLLPAISSLRMTDKFIYTAHTTSAFHWHITSRPAWNGANISFERSFEGVSSLLSDKWWLCSRDADWSIRTEILHKTNSKRRYQGGGFMVLFLPKRIAFRLSIVKGLFYLS